MWIICESVYTNICCQDIFDSAYISDALFNPEMLVAMPSLILHVPVMPSLVLHVLVRLFLTLHINGCSCLSTMLRIPHMYLKTHYFTLDLPTYISGSSCFLPMLRIPHVYLRTRYNLLWISHIYIYMNF